MAEVRGMPPADRTSPAALDELEFADALVTLLPASEAKRVRAELGELGVRVIRIGTLLERMSYDKDVIVLRAGKPVQFLFENSDFMPHNFVIAQPGAMEELGLAAEATATSPDAGTAQLCSAIRQSPAGQHAAAAARTRKARLCRAQQAGRVSLCLHVSWPLAADVWSHVRSGRPGRLSSRPGRLPGSAIRCRSRTTC